MLGYGSNSNFYKAFREEYRVTPREWMTAHKLMPPPEQKT